jgi:hypothetical protein
LYGQEGIPLGSRHCWRACNADKRRLPAPMMVAQRTLEVGQATRSE